MIDINVLKMMNLPEGSPNQKTCYIQQPKKIERGWSGEKERGVWGKGSENKRVGIKAGGLKRRGTISFSLILYRQVGGLGFSKQSPIP